MPHEPEMPRTQTSAPVEPARTTEDARPDEGSDAGGPPPRAASHAGEHGDPTAEHGDRMPLGADEPGAGL